MKKIVAALLVILNTSSIAGEIVLQGFGDSDADSEFSVTYRHPITDHLFAGIIDNGIGCGVKLGEDGSSMVELGYNFISHGLVGTIALGDALVASRSYVNDGVFVTTAAATHDISITDNLTLVPSVRAGWYSDGNAMKAVKMSGVYAINDDWIVRGEASWRGWNEHSESYYSPSHESRLSVLPMYRWSGMQIGAGTLYINEGENSTGVRIEFRMRNPQVRVVVDATQVYSSIYAYVGWSF